MCYKSVVKAIKSAEREISILPVSNLTWLLLQEEELMEIKSIKKDGYPSFQAIEGGFNAYYIILWHYYIVH